MFTRSRPVSRLFSRLVLVSSVVALFAAFPIARVQAASSGLVISEFLANPPGSDSPFEYVELIATRTIDFSATPYSVVFSNNGTATAKGWIEGRSITYGFSITSGTMMPGSIGYVGGSSMLPTGTKLRTIDTGTTGGDGFGNVDTNLAGVLGNGGLNADGIAVFAADISTLTPDTVPVDAVFFGSGIGTAAVGDGSSGYQLPSNDIYSGGKLQTTSALVADPGSGFSVLASGTYDPNSGGFSTPRTWSVAGATDNISEISIAADVTNDPIETFCPATLKAIAGVSASTVVKGVDSDGIVNVPTLTSSPVPGITLDGATAASGVAGAGRATLTIATTTALGTYPITISFSNNDTTPQTAQCTINVTVAPAPRIHEIQGATHISPFNGQTIPGITGVVTALRSNGFYIEDPLPDTDPATSEGIFIFTNAAPTVAISNTVIVTGTITEFRPGGASGLTNLTTTEISASNSGVTVTASGSTLPAATVIGTGGRVPPTTVIEDDATGDVENSGTFDPANDGIDFYESMEGMRVRVNNAVVVGPTNSFGEIVVVADGGANASVRSGRGGVVIRANDFNPERIQIDDAIVSNPPNVNVGDSFPGAVVGVMDYSFGNFELLNTQPLPTPTLGGLTREQTAAPAANELAVATFNVENLDPGDPAAKFNELATLIVSNTQSPDLLAIEEVQDNNGPTNDAVVDADQTFAKLIAAISAAGGPTYEFRQINPQDDQDGGEPGGNIRVGFLFRTDRGLSFVDRAGGTSTNATGVVNSPDGPQLSFSPGRIDPTNAAFASSRKPLAGEFMYQGQTLFVIANHFNSKGGDQPLFGHFQPPTLSSEAQRVQQAEVVRGFVQTILNADAQANVIVLGDLNDFEFSNPLARLKQAKLTPLVETLPQNERYTYVFEGNSQALDHILVSDGLSNTAAIDYDIVHVNAEFAQQASDHDPQVARILFGGNGRMIYLPVVIKPTN